MKKAALLCLAILFHLNVAGQDQLFKTDNTRLQVRIIEIGPEVVRFRLYDSPDGPVHVENKSNIALIIYQNGQHQVFTNAEKQEKKTSVHAIPEELAPFLQYQNGISFNFMTLFNNEVGIVYRREYYNHSISLMVPLAVGISSPGVTQEVYFNTGPVRINIDRKIFEIGAGVNWYPSMRSRNNYYVGPTIRYMQYDVTQEAMSYPAYLIAKNQTLLSRTAVSLTNGFVFRTKSRLTTDIFLSVGFKADKIRDQLYDPGGDPVLTLPEPVALYWWSGFMVGYSF